MAATSSQPDALEVKEVLRTLRESLRGPAFAAVLALLVATKPPRSDSEGKVVTNP